MLVYPMQDTGLKRDTIDKFYTNSQVVQTCINYIQSNIKIAQDDILVEPSAGNGAFIPEMKKMSDVCFFYDIEPEHPEIIKLDFLTLNLNVINEFMGFRKIHIIGNPPFGRQSSSAIAFIKHSAKYADTISFILPKSFKKDSMQRAFPRNFHLIFETDLLENAFIVDRNAYNVPCIFQIWKKSDELRDTPAKLEPMGYEFVLKDAAPEIAFRRVGVNAGEIHTDNLDNKSEQSHYFIRFINGRSLEDNLQIIKKSVFHFNNTVGPKSISKQELMAEWNHLFSENMHE